MQISAQSAFLRLNGLFFVYKPPRLGPLRLRKAIFHRFNRDLNNMEVRPVAQRVAIEGELSKGDNLTVKLLQNYADHPLVVGPRYQFQDYIMRISKPCSFFGSGVTPIGIGSDGLRQVSHLTKKNLLCAYELKGRLGFATDNHTILGEVREKARYQHVTKTRLDMLLSKVEGNHQEQMIQSLGVKMHTQEGYDLLSKGLVHPQLPTDMIIYSLKCIHFQPPDFTIEVQCVNEIDASLSRLVHDIGLGLKTFCTTMSIRRTRFGKYTVDHALLLQQIDVMNVLRAIECIKQDKVPEVGPTVFDEELEIMDELEDFETDYIPLPQDYNEKPPVLNHS